jgi:DNA-binding NarL/FixJ family response regulator
MLDSQRCSANKIVSSDGRFGLPSNSNLRLGTPSPRLDSATGPEPLVLTNAERVIGRLVAQGARNQDIARQLGVSHRTVESHLSNIFSKLGIGSRVQLALWISGVPMAEV